MKYGMKKKIGYSIIILAMLVGFTLIAIFGVDSNGSGSAKDINLGLDLAGGVSITYEVQEDNPSTQDMDDTIYKLEKRVEGKSTESQVYQAGNNRITVEIPGVTTKWYEYNLLFHCQPLFSTQSNSEEAQTK